MEYVTNAPRGAALLDERMPGWADRIDLGNFQIGAIWDCVLGQLFDNYNEGLRELFPDDYRTDPRHEDHPAYTHGYDRNMNAAFPWSALQEEWTALIEERKTA